MSAAPGSRPVRRAILSVYDKTGVVELARGLHDLGVELVSSGGTAAAVRAGGLPVIEVEELTGVPEMLGHRVVTLHPNVHGGILADRDDPTHRADLERHGIAPFDLVVVNLYPFSDEPSIETIDIGGPALARAAAKNHAWVAVVTDPRQYGAVLDELRRNAGTLSAATRRSLAVEAFAATARFDAAVLGWLQRDEPLPSHLAVPLERAAPLRYGENPHQAAARYRDVSLPPGWPDRAVQHGGKELSFINVLDADAGWRLVHRFDEPACVIVKHANPCGVALGVDGLDAYRKAFACDELSAFGGVVACNRPLSEETAEAIAAVFTEVVVVPGLEPGAASVLAAKKNLRVLESPPPGAPALDLRRIDGGFLVQAPDDVVADPSAWKVVTAAAPTDAQLRDLAFAWEVCAAVSSNAIVLARDGQAVGIGAGQQSRVHAAEIAARKAGNRADGGVCASDAFFPFRDGVDAAAAAGARAIVQPGGSVRDDEVIAAADEHGIAMLFTDRRHFRH